VSVIDVTISGSGVCSERNPGVKQAVAGIETRGCSPKESLSRPARVGILRAMASEQNLAIPVERLDRLIYEIRE
jgi:hypothetical protein